MEYEWPDFSIIDTDGVTTTLLAASAGRGGMRVEAVRTWPVDQALSVVTAEAYGRAFKDRLTEWKIAPSPLVVAVGRDRVVLKEVKYPNVPAHEEPAIVRFQAMKELTDGCDEQVIDYQPRDSVGSEKRALVVAAKKEVLRMAQLFAQGSGLKLHAVVPRSFALAALVQSATPPPPANDTVAVLALANNGGEFLTCRGGQVLFARPVSGPSLSSEAALIGEMRRNLAVYSGQAGQAPVTALYVAEGPVLPGVVERMRNTLAVPVHALAPLAGSSITSDATAGQLATAAGIGRLLATGALPINFVKPREPKPPADPHRRPLVLGFGVAIALLLALGGLGWLQLSAKDKELTRLRNDLNQRTMDLTSLEPDARRADELKKWLDNEVVWLDELYDLTAKMPDISRMRITQIIGDPIAAATSADGRKKQFVGRVSLKGVVNDDSVAVKLMNELVKDGHYRVDVKHVGPNMTGTERQRFNQQFSTKYEIEKRGPSTYTRSFSAEVPEKRGRNRGPGGFDIMSLIGGMGP